MASSVGPEPLSPPAPRNVQQFPDRVGPYELLLPIGVGGMATVFLARKRGAGDFQRNVALKLTHPHLRDPHWAQELIEEAKLGARIRHPNVVQVLDVEDDAAGVFLVMEHIEGDTLAALMRHARKNEQPIPLDIGLRILSDALSGLHAAHELRDAEQQLVGLVHRDFTPQNILIGVDGVGRLTDFGVAKAATRTTFTVTGMIKGKIGYMAPEQLRGLPLDRRADIWAAGVVAWELLTGKQIRNESDDAVGLMVDAVSRTPRHVCEARSDVPRALGDAVAGALTLDRVRRWPTAEVFREQLLRTCSVELADASTVGDYVEAASHTKRELQRVELERRAALRAVARSEPPRPSVATTEEPAAQSSKTPLIARPPRRSRRLFAIGALGMAAAAGGVFAWRARAHRDAHASAVPVASSSPASSLVTAPLDDAPPIRPETVAALAPEVPRTSMHVRANAKISRLAVGDAEPLPLAAPSTGATIPSPTASVRVRAIAADGREAQATAAPGATDLALVFTPMRRTGPTASGARAVVLESAPATASAKPPIGKPLAPSPYE